MLVELRTYTVKPLRMGDFLQLYESAALLLKIKYLVLFIGLFASEIGSLNQVVHRRGFDRLAERERRRREMKQDPDWTSYRGAIQDLDLIVQEEFKVFKSLPFSPL